MLHNFHSSSHNLKSFHPPSLHAASASYPFLDCRQNILNERPNFRPRAGAVVVLVHTTKETDMQTIQDLFARLTDYFPMLLTLSPITVVGLGIVALSTLMYLVTRTPEYLLVVLTAMMYSAVPLLHNVR